MESYGQDTCHAYVEGVSTSYGYVPSSAAAAAFVAFFSLSMLLHAGQMMIYRTWWCVVFSIGCLGMCLIVSNDLNVYQLFSDVMYLL